MSRALQTRIPPSLAGLLGFAALCLGLSIGTAACHVCRCDEVDLADGLYEVTDSPERPELLGGLADVSDAEIEIVYVDELGIEWTVLYVVEP